MGVRVVSLVPSVTETLLAWGITPVAVTRFCEHPELPLVGGTKDPDVAAIIALAPDVVVLCEEENRREDADALGAAGLVTCALAIDSVHDVAPALALLAASVGHDAAPASALAPDSRDRADGVRRRAFIPIWRRPWMSLAAGTYGSSLLGLIGIDNIYADAPDRYPTVDLDDAAARRPDLVLAPSEPYPFSERHVAELSTLAPVELIDGQDLFWWGIRTPAAIARLRTRLG